MVSSTHEQLLCYTKLFHQVERRDGVLRMEIASRVTSRVACVILGLHGGEMTSALQDERGNRKKR